MNECGIQVVKKKKNQILMGFILKEHKDESL